MPAGFECLQTPWKLINRLGSWLVSPLVRALFLANSIRWGTGWRFFGAPVVMKHRSSQMSFGPRMQLRSTVRSNPLGANRRVVLCTWSAGAVLKVGESFGMTGGTLCAAERIEIGDRVLVGANSTIIDTDFHPLDSGQRRLDPSGGVTAPVSIDDDVFIGMNSIILKGVHIGRGAVIGAGSVVTSDVPPYAVAAGNPARVVGWVEGRGEPRPIREQDANHDC